MKGYEYIKLLRKNLTLFGLENNYPQNAKPFFFILGLFQCQLQKDKKKRNYAVIIQSVSFRFFVVVFIATVIQNVENE